MKAVVVEDNAGIRAIVVDLLERRGHEVAAFADGESAWVALEDGGFDLAVLDWGLPGIDGLELCRRLRRRPGGDCGVVLVLTGRAEPEDLDEVVASGANDYITKPFKLDQLETRVAFAERMVPVLARRSADIAERARAERVLRERERRHRELSVAAQRQADQLRLLERVRAALDGEIELGRVFRVVVEATAEILGYRYTSLYLREGDELVLQHQVGYDDPERVFYRIPVTKGVSGVVAATGEPALIDDADRDPRFLNALDGVRYEVCVPLRDGDRIVGIFNVETKADQPLNEDDLRLLLGVAEHVNHAIGRARLDDEARASERRLRTVLDSVQEVVFHADPEGRWTFLNRAWVEITGFGVAETLGRYAAEYGAPDRQAAFAQAVRDLSDGTRTDVRGDFRLRTADGGWRWVEAHASSSRDGEPPYAIIGTLVDITQRRQAEEALRESEDRYRHLALHDGLTGLPNRTLFTERLDAELLACTDGDAVAVLFLDLDGFKQVNDTWGHDVGDRLLIEVGDRLQRCVGPTGTAARLGGDEFAIVLRTRPGSPSAEDVAGCVLAAFRAPFALGDRQVALATSVGIAEHAGPGGRTSHLLRNADAALYAAKARGRGVAARHAPVPSLEPGRPRLEAIDGRLPVSAAPCVRYQPVVDLATGAIVRLDLLVHRPHTVGARAVALTDPAMSAVAGPLAEPVLRALGAELAAWRDAFGAPMPRVTLACAPGPFAGERTVARFAERLAAAGIAANELGLRLDGHTLGGDAAVPRAALAALRDLGIELTIGGLGQAPVSLAALADLPADGVAIDPALIGRLGRDRSAGAIVDAIAGLARALGLAATAVGIGTVGQFDRARAAGIPYGQGRHFTRPLSGDAVAAIIAGTRSLAVPLRAADRAPEASHRVSVA